MSQPSTCPKCGAPLAADAPAGLCPQCLVQAGFESAGPSQPGLQATAASPPRSSFEPPSLDELTPRFPQLEFLELLGKGGMGAVYKARQRGLDRLVAVKILPPEVGADPAFAERFMREARAMAQLSHSNIVGVYDFGQAGGLYYFIMEYVDGVNLRQAIQSGGMTPQEALAIVPQICDALQFAHDEGIVHRDIKPENILIDKKGRVKIADFGLAKLLGCEHADQRLTATQQVMGTLRYMAPEQLEGTHAVDHRADIYSLGVVFYELLTGELPIGRFPPPSKKVQIDVRLDEVVLRALEKEPELRYQHASEIKTDVEGVTSKSHVGPGAQVAASGTTESGVRLLLDETDHAARRYQHFFEIGGLVEIAFGVIVAVVACTVNMLGLLPIPIALWVAGAASLVAAGRIRQQWEIDYLGHSIRFENSVYTSGRLVIDGKTMASGGIGPQTELNARIPSGPGAGDRIVVKTHALIRSFRCQLFVQPNASSARKATAYKDSEQPKPRGDRRTWLARCLNGPITPFQASYTNWVFIPMLVLVGLWIVFAIAMQVMYGNPSNYHPIMLADFHTLAAMLLAMALPLLLLFRWMQQLPGQTYRKLANRLVLSAVCLMLAVFAWEVLFVSPWNQVHVQGETAAFIPKSKAYQRLLVTAEWVSHERTRQPYIAPDYCELALQLQASDKWLHVLDVRLPGLQDLRPGRQGALTHDAFVKRIQEELSLDTESPEIHDELEELFRVLNAYHDHCPVNWELFSGLARDTLVHYEPTDYRYSFTSVRPVAAPAFLWAMAGILACFLIAVWRSIAAACGALAASRPPAVVPPAL